ncbi:MAG: hypothetical protein CMJ34_03630 [Phycisphaerae bacterium]|nr:hypothetical protein [Phycisphaerae bacterium]
MRTARTIWTVTLTSILAACGGSDSQAPESASTTSPDSTSRSTDWTPKMTDIWTPAATGDVRTLKSRLDAGADVNALDPDFQGSAIAYAADFGQVEAVRILLAAGADPDVRSGNQSTPAIGAAFFGRPDCLKVLLEAGADPGLADENGITAFSALAIPWEMTKGIADLMEMPMTPTALENGREQCWSLLAPMLDIWGAAATGEMNALRTNLDKGVDVNAPDPIGRTTPLAVAANFGQLEALMMLLAAGADPNARNGNESTPVLGAAFFGRADCLEALLDAGADPSLADENGTTSYTALLIPWQITKAIADAMMIPLDRESLDTGRMECGRILESR